MIEQISPQPTLVVEDIHKCFGPLEVLKGVSVTANASGVLSIVGPSTLSVSNALKQDVALTTTNYNFVTSNDTLATVQVNVCVAVVTPSLAVTVREALPAWKF